MSTSEHEKAFIAAFVVPEKQQRYYDFLSNPKRRGEILNRLNHFFDFIPTFASQITRGTSRELTFALAKLGAGKTAYIIGGGKADGRTLPLEQAVEEGMYESWGVIVSCVPGKLALYAQEYPRGDTFVLRRK